MAVDLAPFEGLVEELADAFFHRDRLRSSITFDKIDVAVTKHVGGVAEDVEVRVRDKWEIIDEFSEEELARYETLRFLIEDEATRRANTRDGLDTPALI